MAWAYSRTTSPAGEVTTTMRSTPAARRAVMTWPSSGRPATLCNTLGSEDFILVPWPAARITAAFDMGFGYGPGRKRESDDLRRYIAPILTRNPLIGSIH